MQTIEDRLRHADRTMAALREMKPGEREMAKRRLVKMRDELELDRDELAADLDDQYDDLTPDRVLKAPKKFERRFGDFHQNLTQYERVCDIIGQIERVVVSDSKVVPTKVAQPQYEERPLMQAGGNW